MANRNLTMGQQIASYLELKAKIKQLELQLKSVETNIKAGMEAVGSNEVRSGGFVARIVEGNQRKFDTNKFKLEHADVYEAYRRDVPTKSFQAYCEAVEI